MKRTTAGFSLIEAMTVLAILAVSLAVAAPSFADALRRNRTRATLHLLSAGMAMARNSAVMRRAAVVVCPQAAGGGCSVDGDWNKGWIVFADADGNRRPDLEADVLRHEQSPVAGDASFRVVSSRSLLRYQPDGRSAHSNLTVHVCEDGKVTGQVIVNNLGRVRSSRDKAGMPCPG